MLLTHKQIIPVADYLLGSFLAGGLMIKEMVFNISFGTNEIGSVPAALAWVGAQAA